MTKQQIQADQTQLGSVGTGWDPRKAPSPGTNKIKHLAPLSSCAFVAHVVPVCFQGLPLPSGGSMQHGRDMAGLSLTKRSAERDRAALGHSETAAEAWSMIETTVATYRSRKLSRTTAMSTADVRCELAAVKQGCREIVGPVIAATRAAIPRYSL